MTIDPTDGSAKLEVHINVPDPAAIPDSVRTALEELAEALAAEEIIVSDEIAATLAEEAEVSGFAAGNVLRLGEIDIFGGGGTLGGSGPIVMDWCLGYSSKDGGSCGVHNDSSESPDNCHVRFT